MVDLAITTRPAYEFILTATAFVTPQRVDSYDAGPAWFTRTEAALGPEATKRMRALTGGCEHVLVRLLGVAHDLPAPGSADGLLDELRRLSAEDVRLTLLGYYSKRTRRRAAPELIREAAAGDAAAQRSFVSAASDGPDCEAALRSILGGPADELRLELLDVLATWREHVFVSHIATVGGILEREVDRLRHRSTELTLDAFLEEVTGGATVVAEPGTETIEVFPHWALRPWNVFWDHATSQIVGVAVPAEHSSANPDDPPDRLVSLAKALGDERRLRILRRLSGGSYTLQELSEHFAIPKTTLLHHLVMLRAAGIVRVGPGASGRYSLRPEMPRELQRLLEAYLPAVPRDRPRD